ncbi:MAG: DUF547 domain-containing protein [Gammaproteobacteria bacterium]|nr:DUF547 domain-containing protein [Gammaproteobacteria bacterium]
MKNINRCLIFCRILLISVISFTPFGLQASESEVPEPFRGSDDMSEITINYDDLTYILRLSVLDLGKSNRKTAPTSSAKTGTLFKNSKNNQTAYEGNRFNFEGFVKPQQKEIIVTLRKSIESVPSEISMSKLTMNEQLAYWLNLYNITLIEQLLNHYPKTKIGDLLHDEDDGLLNKKYLNVAGVSLSLNDIHHKIIIPKFGYDQLVMYGLFQGTIGGPNIRREAYTGDRVFEQLDDNANLFINSNRGTFSGGKGTLMVSTFYETNKRLFPDFQAYLKQHLDYYIDDDYIHNLTNAKTLVANIKDYSIADLTGGSRDYGGSVADNQAALIGSVRGGGGPAGDAGVGSEAMNWEEISSTHMAQTRPFGRYHPDVAKMLQELKGKSKEKTGTVTIKEDKDDDN